MAGLISSSKRELLLKAAELLETRIRIFGGGLLLPIHASSIFVRGSTLMYGFVLSLCALASAQLSTTSQPVSVAICVTGQIRTFTDARVRESQWRLLVGELRRQASVLDVFLVVSGQPHVVTEDVRRWFHEVYGQSTVNVTSAVSSKMSQFLMWSICGEQMRKTGRHYDWSVRSRFDMFFYGPSPVSPHSPNRPSTAKCGAGRISPNLWRT